MSQEKTKFKNLHNLPVSEKEKLTRGLPRQVREELDIFDEEFEKER